MISVHHCVSVVVTRGVNFSIKAVSKDYTIICSVVRIRGVVSFHYGKMTSNYQ